MYLKCAAAMRMQYGSLRLMSPLLAHRKQGRMRQRNHLLFRAAGLRSNEKLNVYGVSVPDGDAILQPSELDFPRSPERVWTCLKQAALVGHDPMLTCENVLD